MADTLTAEEVSVDYVTYADWLGIMWNGVEFSDYRARFFEDAQQGTQSPELIAQPNASDLMVAGPYPWLPEIEAEAVGPDR